MRRSRGSWELNSSRMTSTCWVWAATMRGSWAMGPSTWNILSFCDSQLCSRSCVSWKSLNSWIRSRRMRMACSSSCQRESSSVSCCCRDSDPGALGLRLSSSCTCTLRRSTSICFSCRSDWSSLSTVSCFSASSLVAGKDSLGRERSLVCTKASRALRLSWKRLSSSARDSISCWRSDSFTPIRWYRWLISDSCCCTGLRSSRPPNWSTELCLLLKPLEALDSGLCNTEGAAFPPALSGDPCTSAAAPVVVPLA
uniref:Uncharacterized protein n=1 Tax=Ixodes ricinus TaxID=34613 RepID=A0A147BEU6_IXORI